MGTCDKRFAEGKGTTIAVYLLRTITTRLLEVDKTLHPCFSDYIKAFDRMRHARMIRIFDDLQSDGKDILLIRNIYGKHHAATKKKKKKN